MAKKSEPIFEEVSSSSEPMFEEKSNASSEPMFEGSSSSEPIFEESSASEPIFEESSSSPIFEEKTSEPIFEEKKDSPAKNTTGKKQTQNSRANKGESSTNKSTSTRAASSSKTTSTRIQSASGTTPNPSRPSRERSTVSTSTRQFSTRSTNSSRPASTNNSNSSNQSRTGRSSYSSSTSHSSLSGGCLHGFFVTLGWLCTYIGISSLMAILCGLTLNVAFGMSLWVSLILGLIIGIIITYFLYKEEGKNSGCLIFFGAIMMAVILYGLYVRFTGGGTSNTLYVVEKNVAAFSCNNNKLYFTQESIDSLGLKENDVLTYMPYFDGDTCLVKINIAKVDNDFETNVVTLEKDKDGYYISFLDNVANFDNGLSVKMKDKIHNNEIKFDRLEKNKDSLRNVPKGTDVYTIHVSDN